MLTVEYDPKKGIAVTDGEAEDYVQDLINRGSTSITVGTENLILAATALVAEGKISHEQIRFLYKDEIFELNKNGRFKSSDPFGNFNMNWLGRIIRAGISESKKL